MFGAIKKICKSDSVNIYYPGISFIPINEGAVLQGPFAVHVHVCTTVKNMQIFHSVVVFVSCACDTISGAVSFQLVHAPLP